MKRSEMIHIIQTLLDNAYDDCQNVYHVGDIDAEGILETIEKAGMLPPEYWRPKNYGDGHKLTYSEWCQLPSTIREWEPE